jgi:hypothetical protein
MLKKAENPEISEFSGLFGRTRRTKAVAVLAWHGKPA